MNESTQLQTGGLERHRQMFWTLNETKYMDLSL